MRLLDLFCGAGGAAMGYSRAGFTEIVGVDLVPQPRYPFTFAQGDALAYLADHGSTFDAIHASPPCQGYVAPHFRVTPSGHVRDHPMLIEATRAGLVATGRPWVIENVEGALPAMRHPTRLCGTSFGLPLRRHRLFESSLLLMRLACRHDLFVLAQYPTQFRPRPGSHPRSSVVQVYGHGKGRALWPAAMGIDWMTWRELAQAIPPAYTEHIGRQLIAAIT